MRWYGQLALVAVLGGAGYAGWHAYRTGLLATTPVVGSFIGAPRGAAAPGPARPVQAPVTVDVDTVKNGRVIDIREAVGTVRAFESITVTSKVSGTVQAIFFQEGQLANTNDILVRLDAEERRADIEQAVAETRRAGLLRDEIAVRLERAQSLRRTGSGTEAQVADLTAAVRSAESAIAAADARRKAAEARLEDLVIRAPFKGRLGSRSVSLGAYLSPGTRITTLDDLSRVRLDFSMPEIVASTLKIGQTVRVISAAFSKRIFEGRVSLIDPRVDPVTRSVRLTAEFDNPDETLKPGMFLSVALELSVKEDALVVPEEAIVGEGLRHLIFVVKDNVIERRVVRIGQRQSGVVEIVEGLKLGETIVVRGVQRVRPGMTVDPQPIGDGAPQPTTSGAPAPGQKSAAPTPTAPAPAAGGKPQTAQPGGGNAVASDRRS